jgi:hypothetical protein
MVHKKHLWYLQRRKNPELVKQDNEKMNTWHKNNKKKIAETTKKHYF